MYDWQPMQFTVPTNKKLSYRWQTARCWFVKLLRNCGTFLYVDKKFTRDYNVILCLSIFNSFWVIRCLSQCVSPKKSLFLLHFCFPRGRPCRNHAKRCINEKTIQCLPNPLQHVPICFQQFPSYSNCKCKNRRFHVPPPTFLFPLGTPLRLSRNMLHE